MPGRTRDPVAAHHPSPSPIPMREIDAATAAGYLRDSGRVPPGAEVRVRELAGGVSNIVLRVDPDIARRLGTILGTIHAEAPRHPALRTTLADTSLFDELRVDPYYRTIARRHPDLAPRIDGLIASMNRPDDERMLVLDDLSG